MENGKDNKIHHEKQFSCEICKISFPTDSILNAHNRLHENDNIHKCDLCKEIFLNQYSLINHQSIHQGEKAFKCDLCKKAFSSNSNLITHKKIHTGEKPFKCDLCEKAYTSNHYLTFHKKIHTGEKPFKCDFCGKAFVVRTNLFIHRRIHTGEKPFKCDLCEKTFTCNSDLTKHKKRIHTVKKAFVTSSELTIQFHNWIHLKESTKNTGQHFASTSFVDCVEADVKLEIKEEETLDEDPISINMEAENFEENIKQERGAEMEDTDYLPFKDNSYEDIDVVEHKIEM